MAAYAVCVRLQTFVLMPHTGISQGLQPIVGYNAGRGLMGRALRARNLALGSSLVYGAVTAAALAVLAHPVSGLFLNDPAAVDNAARALRVLALGMTVAGLAPLVAAYSQSMGRPAPAYLLTLGTLLLIKIPLVATLGRLGAEGLWAALAAGEAAGAIVALWLMRRLRDATPQAS
ncbi:MATE family efflux transporter [Streptomyces sp. 840.1]|uniref:MATE family efflux transporter n=1 Tax=Streptomyces sp. 840.1 TaxID=2485152 RepID=UPI0021A931F2|nr:MATE family efflux transporter [Streptomyces sp. 840.1]